MRNLGRWSVILASVFLLVAGQKINLNTATKDAIESLPGVGAVYAKRIVAARPYSSVADLAKSRIPKRTLDQIAPLVTVGSEPEAAPNASPAPAEKPDGGKEQRVWVNFDSKTYHFSNERWYGKTKNGVFMSEAQAKAQGYRAANRK
jgi:hypothetical protein